VGVLVCVGVLVRVLVCDGVRVRVRVCDEGILSSLPDLDEDLVIEIVFGNNKKKFISSTDFNTLSSVTHNQTDPDVLSFIAKLSR